MTLIEHHRAMRRIPRSTERLEFRSCGGLKHQLFSRVRLALTFDEQLVELSRARRFEDVFEADEFPAFEQQVL